MEKIDFKKLFRELYFQSAKKISRVKVPAFNYLAIDGAGHPENNPDFEEKLSALYGIAYTIKFMLKNPLYKSAGFPDYVVPPLEGFWFMDDCTGFDSERKDDWRWTLMIMQPEFITGDLLEKAKKLIIGKGKETKGTGLVRLEKIEDGESVQLLHVGPYNQVEKTVALLKAELASNKLVPARKYREIYLSDPRKTKPEKLRTICRMPYSNS